MEWNSNSIALVVLAASYSVQLIVLVITFTVVSRRIASSAETMNDILIAVRDLNGHRALARLKYKYRSVSNRGAIRQSSGMDAPAVSSFAPPVPYWPAGLATKNPEGSETRTREKRI